MFVKMKQEPWLLKKVPELQETYGREQIYFQDEMRYGTRTALKRRWTRQGKRPKCEMKIGYESAWLYVAICPENGDMLASFISHLDKECFELFAKQFEEHLQEKKIEKEVLMIAGGSTAHQQSCLREQVKLLKLPTACPELNPVERFFEELRKSLSNRMFESIEEVEKCLEFWVEDWKNKTDKIINLTNFKWIKGET